jgi:hypothetical protein
MGSASASAWQAQSEAAGGRLAASEVEASGGDAATEVENLLRAARLQNRHERPPGEVAPEAVIYAAPPVRALVIWAS